MVRIAAVTAFVGARAVLLRDMIMSWMNILRILLLLHVLIRVQIIHVIFKGRNYLGEIAEVGLPLSVRALALVDHHTILLIGVRLRHQSRRYVMTRRIIL